MCWKCLNTRERDVLNFLQSRVKEHNPPTQEEIADFMVAIGWPPKRGAVSSIRTELMYLKHRGMISWSKGNFRSVKIHVEIPENSKR